MITGKIELNDKEYPERIREIKTAPEVMYYAGDVSALSAEHSVAIIGTRNATEEGYMLAKAAGEIAAKLGFVVVNGLAVGIDTAALKGALHAGGRCVVTLPSGLEDIYPPSNQGLAKEIVDAGGCLLTEYTDGSLEQYRFAQRDRLQSALSDLVIVIEADEKSGTMITADYAVKFGKPLACCVSEVLRRNAGGAGLVDAGKAEGLGGIKEIEAYLKRILEEPRFTQMRLDI